MPFKLPIATDNADAMKRVGDRLEADVSWLIEWSIRTGHVPFWVLCRSLFPIAESIAYLLLADFSTGTSAQLSELFNRYLALLNPRYKDVSHVLCQIWRHGLTHGDEPPTLHVENAGELSQRSMSWNLTLNDSATHLSIVVIDAMNAQVVFSLEDFYNDLLKLARDPMTIASFAAGVVADRYNDWTVKELDDAGATTEQRKAAVQINAILP